MLRFAHIADLHVGRQTHSSINTETGLQSNLANDVATLNEFIDASENVDFVVIAGDIFDKIHVSNSVRKEMARIIRRLLNTKDVYIIVGTHDRNHDKYASHSLSDWSQLVGCGPDHMSRLHIFEEPTVVLHKNNGKIEGQIIALPEPTKGMLEGKTYLQYIESAFESFEIDESLPTLVIGHFTVSGTKRGDEVRDLASFNPDESIPSEFFDDKKYIDYVALGHIHRKQEIGRTGKISYSGSLNYCSFSEVNMVKGGYVCTITDDKVLEKKFIELKSPIPLKEMRIDVSGNQAPMTKLREILSSDSYKNSIVKVVVKLNESERKNIDEEELRSLLGDAVSKTVNFDVVRTVTTRDAALTRDLSHKEAYEKYLALRDIDSEMKSKMIEEFGVIWQAHQAKRMLDVN